MVKIKPSGCGNPDSSTVSKQQPKLKDHELVSLHGVPGYLTAFDKPFVDRGMGL